MVDGNYRYKDLESQSSYKMKKYCLPIILALSICCCKATYENSGERVYTPAQALFLTWLSLKIPSKRQMTFTLRKKSFWFQGNTLAFDM